MKNLFKPRRLGIRIAEELDRIKNKDFKEKKLFESVEKEFSNLISGITIEKGDISYCYKIENKVLLSYCHDSKICWVNKKIWNYYYHKLEDNSYYVQKFFRKSFKTFLNLDFDLVLS